jgi:hypothetical protein
MTDRLIRLQALNETLTNEKAALQMRLNSEVQVRLACVSPHTFFFCGQPHFRLFSLFSFLFRSFARWAQSRREREGVRRSGEVDMKHSSGDITSIIINTGAEPAKSGTSSRQLSLRQRSEISQRWADRLIGFVS